MTSETGSSISTNSLYDNPQAMSGLVAFAWTSNVSLVVSYNLNGLDEDCFAQGADPHTANSCGFHLSESTDCADASAPLWNPSLMKSNPWPTYNDARSSHHLTYGYEAADSVDRAFAIFDRAGALLACAPVPHLDAHCVKSEIKKLSVYPGWKPQKKSKTKKPKGKIKMKWYDYGHVEFEFDIKKYPKACKKGPSVNAPERACTMAFHEGFSCDSDATVLDTYYNTATLESDPFLNVAYQKGKGKVRLNYGIGSTSTVGRTLVMYDEHGARWSCNAVPPYKSSKSVDGGVAWSPEDVWDVDHFVIHDHAVRKSALSTATAIALVLFAVYF
jgi:hypothetical protein